MGIRDVGEWKHYAFERFRSILHLTVRNALKTNSPIPGWAASKVVESWNIPTLDADGNQGTGSNCGLSTDCARTMAQDDKRRGFRKTYPLTIVPSRGALAEHLQGLECLMAGTEATSPSSKRSHPAGPTGAAGCQPPSHRIEGSALHGADWQPANLSPGP